MTGGVLRVQWVLDMKVPKIGNWNEDENENESEGQSPRY